MKIKARGKVGKNKGAPRKKVRRKPAKSRAKKSTIKARKRKKPIAKKPAVKKVKPRKRKKPTAKSYPRQIPGRKIVKGRKLRDILTQAKELASKMDKALLKAEKKLSDYGARRHLHINHDGSIDGEIRLKMPSTKAAREKAFAAVIAAIPASKKWWVSTQLFYDPSLAADFDSENIYLRGRGGMVGMAFRARKTQAGAQLKALAARHVSRKIERKSKLPPAEIVIRTHWNAENIQPIYQPKYRPKTK